jgi:hypothetical protein
MVTDPRPRAIAVFFCASHLPLAIGHLLGFAPATNGKWQMANGQWQMANGKWRFSHAMLRCGNIRMGALIIADLRQNS